MSQDTERLEREADAHRNQVDDTIDQLKSRFSVGQIAEELSSYVREGQGADMVNNLGRQVRDNPLALGLIGAGVAWLFLGDTARDQGGRLRHRYDDWRDDRDYDRFAEAFPPGSDSRTYGSGYPDDMGRDFASERGGGARYGYNAPPRYPVSGGSGSVGYTGPSSSSASSGGPGMMDRTRSAASGVGSGVSGAASSAGSAVSGAASSAGSAISGAAGSVRDAAASAGHSVGDGLGRMGESANRYSHDARDAAYRAGDAAYRGAASAGRGVYRAGRQAQRTFIDTLQEEPLVIGAVAVALGAAIGAALPSTRREDELFGEARDHLRDDAYAYGRDAVDRATHVAEEAYRAGSEEAERKGLKPEPGGETLAEKVSSVARTAAEAAKSEVRKEVGSAEGSSSETTKSADMTNSDTRREGGLS